MVFGKDKARYQAELELLVNSVPFVPAISMELQNGSQETSSSCYVLPVDIFDGRIYGFFDTEWGRSEVIIGLVHKPQPLKKDYYTFCENGLLTPTICRDDTYYLPLRKTGLTTRSSPILSVIGITGSQGLYPLLFVFDTDEGYKANGIALQTANSPTYPLRNLNIDKDPRNLLSKFMEQFKNRALFSTRTLH